MFFKILNIPNTMTFNDYNTLISIEDISHGGQKTRPSFICWLGMNKPGRRVMFGLSDISFVEVSPQSLCDFLILVFKVEQLLDNLVLSKAFQGKLKGSANRV